MGLLLRVTLAIRLFLNGELAPDGEARESHRLSQNAYDFQGQ